MANIPKITPAVRARREAVRLGHLAGKAQETMARELGVAKVTVRFDLITLGLIPTPALDHILHHLPTIKLMYLDECRECDDIAEYLGVTPMRMEYLMRLMHATGWLPYRPDVRKNTGPEPATLAFLAQVKAVPGWQTMAMRDLAAALLMPMNRFKSKYKRLVAWRLVEPRIRGAGPRKPRSDKPATPPTKASVIAMESREKLERKQAEHSAKWRDVMRGIKPAGKRVVGQ